MCEELTEHASLVRTLENGKITLDDAQHSLMYIGRANDFRISMFLSSQLVRQ